MLQKYRPTAGFTLIELMVVLVIIGILATIAYPSYLEQVRQSRRADAMATLMELSHFMERHYTINNTYAGAALPESNTNFYTFTIATQTANAYTLSAAPGASQSNDRCGTLTLTHRGLKTAATDRCWN